MLNQVILVGRLVKDLKVEKEEETKICKINLAIPRSFKNADGTYDTDFIECIAFDSIAENTSEYCNKGDIVGIKGRLQSKDNKMELIAEKVTFLSSKPKE